MCVCVCVCVCVSVYLMSSWTTLLLYCFIVVQLDSWNAVFVDSGNYLQDQMLTQDLLACRNMLVCAA